MPTTTPVEYFEHISLSFMNLYSTIMCYKVFSQFRFLEFHCVFIVYSTLDIISLVYIFKFIFEGCTLGN